MKVRATSPIKADGVNYAPGEVLEVTLKQARELAEVRGIELSPVIEPEPESADKKSSDKTRPTST